MKHLYFVAVTTVLLFNLFFNLACTRANNSDSRVQIELPQNPNPRSYNLIQSLLMSSVTSSNITIQAQSPNWSTEPATPAEGSNPVNCYFATVYAPDLVADRKFACYRYVLGNKNPIVEYGVIGGASYEGQTLEINVPPGENREITLFGVHAQSQEYCTKLVDPSFDKARLSRPYIVGNAAINILKQDVEVPMTVNFDENKVVDGCDLLLESENNTSSSFIKTVLIGNSANGEHIANNNCYQIQTYVTDSSGSQIFSGVGSDLTLSLHNNFGSFATKNSCIAAASPFSGDTTFVYEDNTPVVRRWIKANSTVYNHNFLRLATVPSGYTELLTPLFTHTAPVVAPVMSLPSQILNDTCYPISFTAQLQTSPSTSRVLDDIITFAANSSAAGVVKFHSTDSTCALATASDSYTLDYNSSGFTKDTIYFKINSFANYSDIVFTAGYTVTPTSATTTTISTTSRIGLAEDVRLKATNAILVTQDASNSSCYGPFRLSLTNFDGTEVKNTLTVNRSFRVSNTVLYATKGIGLSNDVNCSSIVPTGDAGIDFTIPVGFSSKDFYVKTAAQSTIDFTNSGIENFTITETTSGGATSVIYVQPMPP